MNTVKPVTSSSFQETVIRGSHELPVLVDFWAPWCGPCQALGPVLEKAAAEFAGQVAVVKLNTDEESAIAGQYAIRSIPAVKLFRDGKVIGEFVGAQPLPAIRQFLQSHLSQPAGGASTDAAPAPVWITVAALARAGKFDEAQSLLDGLTPDESTDGAVQAASATLHFARLARSPDETDLVQSARVRAAQALLADDLERGFAELLQVMQRNRRFATGQGRTDLLLAFALTDRDDPRVAAARRRLAALLN